MIYKLINTWPDADELLFGLTAGSVFFVIWIGHEFSIKKQEVSSK